jgi:hypothetical protein
MFESPIESETKTSRSRSTKIVGVTAAVFVVIIGGAIYLNHQRASETQIESEPYRAGSAEFDAYLPFIDIEQQEPQGSENMLGQVIVVARAILHNRGQQTLTQIEVRAVVYDAASNKIGQRVARPVPRVRSQLGPGESMLVQVNVDSLAAGADPAAATVLLQGLRFQEASP